MLMWFRVLKFEGEKWCPIGLLLTGECMWKRSVLRRVCVVKRPRRSDTQSKRAVCSAVATKWVCAFDVITNVSDQVHSCTRPMWFLSRGEMSKASMAYLVRIYTRFAFPFSMHLWDFYERINFILLFTYCSSAYSMSIYCLSACRLRCTIAIVKRVVDWTPKSVADVACTTLEGRIQPKSIRGVGALRVLYAR